MVERLNGIQEVIGSIPTISTKKRERFCRSRFMVDRYKGDKRPKRSHPVYLRQQILARKTLLVFRWIDTSVILSAPIFMLFFTRKNM